MKHPEPFRVELDVRAKSLPEAAAALHAAAACIDLFAQRPLTAAARLELHRLKSAHGVDLCVTEQLDQPACREILGTPRLHVSRGARN